MGIERQHESDKLHGDKLESAIDRQAAGGPGRKGQNEPEDEKEVDLEDREEPEVEDSDDE